MHMHMHMHMHICITWVGAAASAIAAVMPFSYSCCGLRSERSPQQRNRKPERDGLWHSVHTQRHRAQRAARRTSEGDRLRHADRRLVSR